MSSNKSKVSNDNRQLSLFEDTTQTPFDRIKHIDEKGECWYARELQPVFDYDTWRRFEETIERAKISCEVSGYLVSEHFAEVGKTIPMPKGAKKLVIDYRLTRYACYLIAMNGDPRKKVIADAQTYFAVQTRKQELIDQNQTNLINSYRLYSP